MRYDAKGKRIELFSYELCSKKEHIYSEDYIDDIAGDVTSGLPCDVFLSKFYDGIDFYVSGHIPAVYGSHDLPTISEIIINSDALNMCVPSPSANICCLAYMMCKTYGIDEINIETILYDSVSNKHVGEIRTKRINQLEKHFEKRIKAVISKAHMLIERCNMVLPGAASVKFPFSVLREGQKNMMRSCYEAMSNKARIFVQAPTGIGKTISALYSAVKFLAANVFLNGIEVDIRIISECSPSGT